MNRGVCLLWVVSSLLYIPAVLSQSDVDTAIADATVDGTVGGTAEGDSLSPDKLLANNNLADETDLKLGALEIFAEKVLSLTNDLPPEYCKDLTSTGFIFSGDCSSEADTKYRRLDGTCNNLEFPSWGKAHWPLLRIAPAAYADGISEKRAHSNPKLSLPNPRDVSVMIGTTADIEGNDPYGSMALAILGQLIDHDVAHAPQFGSTCDDCSSPVHSSCCPIKIDVDDLFYKGETECMALPRTVGINAKVCASDSTDALPREHLNDITAYLDASAVYGSTQSELDELKDGYLMKTLEHPAGLLPFLPVDSTEKMCRGMDEARNVGCALAGDSRASEQPTLTGFHTMFVRYHNVIARQIKERNNEWTDDTIFEETKKIVSAVFQHIVYNEYLPALLGAKPVEHFGLKIRRGRSDVYDETVSATLSNEFAGAAYRLGHSQIPVELETRSNDNKPLRSVQLRHAFFNASAIYDSEINGMNGFILGNINQRVNKIDRHFSSGIQGHLFEDEETGRGLDLIAINIQRGREHGLNSYTVYYEKCNHDKKISSWNDYLGVFQDDYLIKELANLYGPEGYREIDLFIGLMIEKHVEGGRVGPTLACIVGNQFRRFRHGDRFWYERNEPEGFSDAKLAAIKQVSLSSVICSTLDNSDELQVQPYALYTPVCQCDSVSNGQSWVDYSMDNEFPGVHLELPGFTNHRVKCSDERAIPRLNLDPWKVETVSYTDPEVLAVKEPVLDVISETVSLDDGRDNLLLTV
nr:heme peroxidase 2-like [Lytechinus pictus]